MIWKILHEVFVIILDYFLIVTLIDVIIMGNLHIRLKTHSKQSKFMIDKKNRLDIQKGSECSAFSSSYLLRHHDIEAEGMEVYSRMTNKFKDGSVTPLGVKKMLQSYGFKVRYCRGNLNALKDEVAKGNPVIVLVKVRMDKRWLHYIPVVGYDEEYVYIAESFEELVNCESKVAEGKGYNRKITQKEFKKLWNTTMLKMPLYANTYFEVQL